MSRLLPAIPAALVVVVLLLWGQEAPEHGTNWHDVILMLITEAIALPLALLLIWWRVRKSDREETR